MWIEATKIDPDTDSDPDPDGENIYIGRYSPMTARLNGLAFQGRTAGGRGFIWY